MGNTENTESKVQKMDNYEENFKNNQKIEEYRKKLANSSEVIDFVQTQSKYIERILGEKNLLKIIYENDDKDVEEEEILNIKKEGKEKIRNLKKPISSIGLFQDESLIFKRTVTDIEWSNKFPEILLAGYSKSDESNINDPNGLLCIWSLALRKKPEYVFTCQSELTKVILHPFNPKLVIGASNTGQILMWDTRGKSLPIMKTPPGGKYHSYPIYCMSVMGSSNNNNIVSVSNDGILCTWSSSNLSKATKRIELKAKKKKKIVNDDINTISSTITKQAYSDEFGVICMASQESETNHMFIGTDDSEIYQVSTHQR